MSMTFFFFKVCERPATRQHPCANNNGYGFQNEQIANRCFFSVINRHNVCEKKKKKTFQWVENVTNWFDELFSREENRKKKGREKLGGNPLSCQPHSPAPKHNFTSQLDKRAFKNKIIEKKKREIQTPCHCTGWKSVQTWRWAKDSRLRVAAPDPRNIDNPSVWMSYWSAPLCCHTHPPFAPRNYVRIWRLWTHTARIAFPNANCTKFQAMQGTRRAWQKET